MARILIVEDSPSTRQAEASFLEAAGHECLKAGSASQALEMMDSVRPDLFLIDYELPDENGLQLMKLILRQNPQALMIIVTGKGDEKLAAEVMRTGAKDYVPKVGNFIKPLLHVVERVLVEEEVRGELEARLRKNDLLQAQNEVAFWLGHNFRNFFSGALGFLQLIDSQDGQTREERLYYKRQALASLTRASELVDQLMHLTDLTPHSPSKVDFHELVELTFEAVFHDWKKSNSSVPEIRFINETQRVGTIKIWTKDARLILESLFKNSMESIGERGEIAVSASVSDQGVLQIQVRDDGRGMDEETMNQALVPLFSTKGTVGSGMGLSLAYAALKKHGGDLSFESSPGQGATITITWPLETGRTP